jgi:RND family efflux transporter MFP subunit
VKNTTLPTLLFLSTTVVLGSCVTPSESSSTPAGNPVEETAAIARMPVEVVEVQREDVTETLELTGTVTPWDEFAISSEIMGTVAVVYRDEGDWIQKGDLLLELDRSKLELQLKSRKADLNRAEVELEFAKKRLGRGRALLLRGAISQSDVDNLEERVNLANSSVEVSKLAVASVEEDLKDTKLFSPATGQISRRLISLGETVNPAAVLFKLLQLEPIKVLTEITEPYLAEIRPGQQVQLRLDAFPDQEFTGRVHKIQPVAAVESGSFPLEIRLSNARRSLQAGMIARVALRGKVFSDVLVVPLESVVNTEGENFVFVVDGGRAQRRSIDIRQRIGTSAIVDADLTPGDKVVTRGLSNLTDGTPVELIV